MMIYKLYVGICSCWCFSILAQDANNLGNKTAMRAFDSEISIGKSGLWVPKVASSNTVSGSVYLFDNWIGLYTVVGKNHNTTQILNLNYNLQTKNLESSVGKDSIFQYDLGEIDLVKEGQTVYKVVRNEQVNGLFVELYAGSRFQIYKEMQLGIKKGAFDRLTQAKVDDDRYVQVPVYYVVQAGVFQREKMSKKLILKLVQDKKEAVSKYASQYDLSYTNDADLSRILIYYSSL